MFKFTYNLRVFVEENSQIYPLQVYTLIDEEPIFDNLVNKIQRHIHLKNYFVLANNQDVLYDNRSLQNALKSVSGDLEIVLHRKPTLNYSKRETNIPESIPTISKLLPSHPRKRLNNDDDKNDCHKYSDVFSKEPLMKKEKLNLVNNAKRLPYPPSSVLSSHRNTNMKNIETKDNSANFSVFALSLSSESLPHHHVQYPSFRLPSVTSIVDSKLQKLDIQLAPIYSRLTKKKRQGFVSTSTNFHICDHRTKNGDICGQVFKRPYDLSRHKDIHLENRVFFYCDVCNTRFTRSDALRRHERVQGHSLKYQDAISNLKNCLV